MMEDNIFGKVYSFFNHGLKKQTSEKSPHKTYELCENDTHQTKMQLGIGRDLDANEEQIIRTQLIDVDKIVASESHSSKTYIGSGGQLVANEPYSSKTELANEELAPKNEATTSKTQLKNGKELVVNKGHPSKSQLTNGKEHVTEAHSSKTILANEECLANNEACTSKTQLENGDELISNEAQTTETQLENKYFGSKKDNESLKEQRTCQPCAGNCPGICNLEFKEQQSILLEFDGVKSIGLKPNEFYFSIYLYDKDDEDTKKKITEKHPQHQFYFRAAPITQSFSFGVGEKLGTPNTGTLGGYISLNRKMYALTCHHVVKDVPLGGKVGIYRDVQDHIRWYPIGTLQCSIAFDRMERTEETYDIALIEMSQQVQADECRNCEMATIDGLKQRIIDIGAGADITVQKNGAVTGEREGTVTHLRYNGKIPYKENGHEKSATFLSVIQIKNDGETFAKKGDSGSIVYYKDDSKVLVIGMFFALESTDQGEFAYAFPLQNAFKKLKDMYPDIFRDITFEPNENIRFTCYGEICQETMATN